ncbi:MAG TPA: proline--tRNA ligase [Syntrophales bacterium]|nr:proline--tRNA ligase [Syntrophales bacterium]HPB70264.1 proline--tRNA ligase [Syntrophales bacterium]HQN24814.1 proline--tRNA ligase [Syntrophales bacterium]HQP28703.1 proline--tRNA ligase [Syntrophales bacterium]
MRYSELFLPTGREVPSDAELASHQLMIRAGMIRKLTSGIYSYLPMGYRVIRKVEQIVREEMNRAGAQELFMPMVQPAELWQESGRWVHYGRELLRFRDRHEREYCLGPTHEEVITDLVRNEIKTYRQLPRNLYQIQTKFRDEIRPRFGVMRCREFAMKDAYSFDANEAGAEESYRKMFEAYGRIFRRCGLDFRAVEADSGSIGGSYSHEFMVMADSGEDAVVFCTACDYAANLEKAEIAPPEKTPSVDEARLPLEEVHTPGVRTIEEVCAFLSVTPQEVVKTLIFNADGKPAAILVRGDHDVNEIKVKNVLGCDELELAMDDMILDVTGSPRGFAGAVGIRARVIADYSLINMTHCVMGANREDYHLKNASPERDFSVSAYADLRVVRAGDPCPRCAAPVRMARGIEVGHVFKLGTKYSRSMRAVYLDAAGKEQTMVMGCYGIGIGRTVAAAIEQSHDDQGIVWPMTLAPYAVIITPVNSNEETLARASESLYQALSARGVEVLLDDRDERAGVKFKDADLIGIPLRITVGPKKLAEGRVELRIRRTGEVRMLPLGEAVDGVSDLIRAELERIGG